MAAWSRESIACFQSRKNRCSSVSVVVDHSMALLRVNRGCLMPLAALKPNWLGRSLPSNKEANLRRDIAVQILQRTFREIGL